MKLRPLFLAVTLFLSLGLIAYIVIAGKNVTAIQKKFIVDTLATNLTVPWAIAFLPDGSMLFTERAGRVRMYKNKQLVKKSLLFIAETDSTKKMGLLGLCMHPQFKANRFVYLTYNYRKGDNPLLRVVRYQLSTDSLIKPHIIVDNILANQNHTGCRLKFGPDKKLYITTGDADRPALAQDLKSLNGKILRLNDDGSVPADNPFAKNDTARKEIWSYGHRNPQGIDFQPGTNYLFSSEHGPSGGDEINQIIKGKNYGWPVIHHNETKPGMLSPLLEYTPSVGPSEAVFYNADAFPAMKGNLLVACLRGESILGIKLNGQNVISQEVLLKQQYGRIRALTVGPDGYIYFSTSQLDPPEGEPRPGYDMILRLRPVPGTNYDSFNANAIAANPESTPVKNNAPAALYKQLCASCHGVNLQGTKTAKSLVDGKWDYGKGKTDIIKNIANGITDQGMPAWQGAISATQIEQITDYIIAQEKKKEEETQ